MSGNFHEGEGISVSVCFFIGHRDAPSQVRELLESAVERHICLYGVTDFYVGRYGRFDSMAANAVKSAKTRHPGVTLTMLLAYHPYERPIQTPDGFDGTFYPPNMETVPRRYAIVRANRYMVMSSDYLIAYDAGYVGNTRELVTFAHKREEAGKMRVTNLAKIES